MRVSDLEVLVDPLDSEVWQDGHVLGSYSVGDGREGGVLVVVGGDKSCWVESGHFLNVTGDDFVK